MSNFQPLNDHILVKIKKQEKKTESGLIIPDTTDAKRETGEVVGISPGAGEAVAIGDKVMFRKNGAETIEEQDDATLLLVPFKDLLGKYTQSDAI